ncbi:MAG: hypothetical protein ABW039_02295 [Sphingobium sp.]
MLNAPGPLDIERSARSCVSGRNLTDNRAYDSTLSFAAPLGFTSVARREPTTYGVTATFKFGG